MELLERDEQLTQLEAALEHAREGNGRVVLVRGEAGIGKTTLMRAFIDRSQDRTHLLTGACDDLLSTRPLEPFRDMAEQEPDLLDALDEADSRALFEALSDLLSRSMRPTVIVLEDVHWADQATLDLLRRVGRRIDQTHGLVVMTFRDEEAPVEHPLRIVIGDIPAQSMVRLRLEPLHLESVAQLAGEETAQELHHLTGGNPLLVTEMVRSDEHIPTSISDLTLARLARLPESARSIAQCVSIVPGQCEREVLDACVSVEPADLAMCEQRGILEVSATHVSFRHELLRRAVEASLTEAVRVELNSRLLEVLEEAGAVEERLVHHASQAGDTGALLRYVPVAARSAAMAASYREAVSLYDSLQPMLDRYPPEQRAELLEEWSDAEFYLGEMSKAHDLRIAAAGIHEEVSDDLTLARCLVHLSIPQWRMHQPDRALSNAAHVVDLMRGTNASPTDLAEAYATQAFVFALAAEQEEARESLDHVFDLIDATDEPELEARARAIELWTLDDPVDRLFEKSTNALAFAKDVGAVESAGLIYQLLVTLDDELHPTKRDETPYEALQFARENLLGDTEGHALIAISERHLLAGRFKAAEEVASEATSLYAPDELLNVHTRARMAHAQLRRGAPQAGETISYIFDLEPRTPWINSMWTLLSEAHWLDDDHPFDADIALDELRFLERSEGWSFRISAFAYWMWKLGLINEIPQQTLPQYQRLMEGDWKGSALQWADWERPYEQALALAEGDTQARLHALSILDEIGAVPLASRIRAELRRAGVKGVPRGPTTATREHEAGLTTRQNEVLELLSRNMSNSDIADELFISLRTAEHHVAAVITKLDAKDRHDAVTRANESGLLDESDL